MLISQRDSLSTKTKLNDISPQELNFALVRRKKKSFYSASLISLYQERITETLKKIVTR